MEQIKVFFNKNEIIEGFIPRKTNLKLETKGRVFEMSCNKKIYKFELIKKIFRIL